MIKATVKEILQGSLDHVKLEGIYIFRDDEYTLYVGRSVNVISRILDHIKKWTTSPIGDLIKLNTPESLKWQVELMEPEECRQATIDDGMVAYLNLETKVSTEDAEEAMIRQRHPCLNTTGNFYPSRLPEHIKCYQLEVGVTDHLF